MKLIKITVYNNNFYKDFNKYLKLINHNQNKFYKVITIWNKI